MILTCSFCTRVLQPGTTVCTTCGTAVGAPKPRDTSAPATPPPPARTSARDMVVGTPASTPPPHVKPLPRHETVVPGLPPITVFGATSPLLVQPGDPAPDVAEPTARGAAWKVLVALAALAGVVAVVLTVLDG